MEFKRHPEELDSEDCDPFYYVKVEDTVERKYFPIRDKYIRIVKSCRKQVIESYEKRGRKDFKRTAKYLYKLGRHLASERHLNFY